MNSVVASNSLVNKNHGQIEEHCLIDGIPAKFITNGVERLLLQDSEVDKLLNSTEEIIDNDEVKKRIRESKYH